ncbi:hypothetical protein [Corallococcus exercitus]|uniref:Uncharacterized protein n=1 Tax=Corallococcus exercitus TaxID=2316736 RepID=A0A7Y4JLZ1_9BACT|nr:hypothetical protein [Corallococcus exercitus]NOK07470.1 hypothetical protein [Corallococcus exercitus]
MMTDANPETALAIGACLAYLALLLVTRWFMVAKPDRELLREHIQQLYAELSRPSGKSSAEDGRAAAIKSLLQVADKLLDKRYRYFWCWTGAYEASGWYLVHEAKRRLVADWNWQEVEVRLHSAVYELREPTAKRVAEGVGLADDIVHFLESIKDTPSTEQQLHGKSLLNRALRIIYSREGEETQDIYYWHNRIMWLATCSLGFISILTLWFGQPGLFLLGGAGGFLSRLSRLRVGNAIPQGYETFWAVLFISPLIGALAGWLGVLVAHLLVEQDLLGSDFQNVTWGANVPPTHASLGVAFLCGLSEGFFQGLIARWRSATESSVTRTSSGGIKKEKE